MADKPDAPTVQERAAEDDQDNRRQYERIRVSQPVKLEATLRGRFIDIMRLEMSGQTIDMSRGGVLANVDQSITPGVRCRVDFAEIEGKETPESLWGRVRRTTTGKDGFIVAIEFDEPVRAVKALGESVGVVVQDTASGADDDGSGETVTGQVNAGESHDEPASEASAQPAPKQRKKTKKHSTKRKVSRKKKR